VGRSGLFIVSDTLTPGLKRAPARVHAAIVATVKRERPQTEGHSRQTAPWTDRTGNARAGLTATTEHSVNLHAINLFHTVPYGIWLEIAHGGEYQVILPTIQDRGPRLMASFAGLLSRVS
jgi:hypothetical protein